jgi:hypothetical protein
MFSAMAASMAQLDRSADAGHRVLGVGLLMDGRNDEAVRSLEESLTRTTGADEVTSASQTTRNADTLNDLSVAYLSRQRADDAADAMRALDAAERAWSLQKSPEIAWNRALAREAVHVRAASLTAWNDYLTLDPDSKWAAEAETHVRSLTKPRHSQRWAALGSRIETQDADYEELAREFPQELRSYGEETLLRRWCDAAVNHGNTLAAQRAARKVGDAIARASGDHLLAESVDCIEHAVSAEARAKLASAHQTYTNGKSLFTDQQMLAAARKLRTSEQQLIAAGSSFSLRAALYASTAEYYAGQLHVAADHLSHIQVRLAHSSNRYPTLTGQVEWLSGLVAYARGHNNEAAYAYTRALTAFERAGEEENQAGVVTVLAALHRHVGDETGASAYQQQALESLDQLGTTRRSHSILTGAAITAEGLKLPFAALVFQADLLAITRASRDPVSICDALISHSRYAAVAGDQRRAEADLHEAGSLIHEIKDSGLRMRCLSNLLAAEATVWRIFDPKRVASTTRRAVAMMNQLDHHVFIVSLQLEAGRAHRAIGHAADALQSWQAGIQECEHQRANLTDQSDRRRYFEQCAALFSESTGLLAQQGRFSAALALAEQGRARGLREALTSTLTGPASIPSDVTIIEYAVVPQGIVLWTIDTIGVKGALLRIRHSDLKASIDLAASEHVTATDLKEANALLYDRLITPIASGLRHRVVVIPDGDLFRVAFAGLWDRETDKYFIESHELSIAPSLGILTSTKSTPWRVPSRVALIDAGDIHASQQRDAPSLPSTRREIADIARLYPDARVVQGRNCTKAHVLTSFDSCELIHFAGHGRRGSATIDPALVLRSSTTDQGLLYPNEIATLSLHMTRLAVLGACDTANGQIGSEGPLSIARAFLAAGVERVVATMSPIDDDRAREVLTAFHRSLRDDVDPIAALRVVQINAIHHGSSARNWAVFEVIRRGF